MLAVERVSLRDVPRALSVMPLRVGAVEINDVILSVTVPFVVYWVTAFIYETLARSDAKWLNKYRIHAPKAEDKFNLVRSIAHHTDEHLELCCHVHTVTSSQWGTA